MKEWFENQLIQTMKFISRDRTISDSEKTKAYADVFRRVSEAANIFGESDSKAWMKRIGIEQDPV